MLAVKENKTPLIDRLIELGSDVCARNNVSSHESFFIITAYNVFLESSQRNEP